MAYALYSDVQAMLPQAVAISSESYPTLTSVNGWLDQYSSDVNITLTAAGFTTVPVATTDTDKYNKCKLMVAQRVAYQVMLVRSTNYDPQRKPFWADYKKDFEDFLATLAKGLWPLPVDSDLLPSSRTMDAETNGDANMQPLITRDREY